jgi:hypothetical protein
VPKRGKVSADHLGLAGFPWERLPLRQRKRCNKKPEGELAPQETGVAAPQQLNNICATLRVDRADAAIPPYNKTTSKALACGWEMSGVFCFDLRWRRTWVGGTGASECCGSETIRCDDRQSEWQWIRKLT